MVLLQFSKLLCTLMKRAQGGDPAVVRLTEELNKKYECEFPGCDAFIVACEEGRFNDIEHYVNVANVDVNAKGPDSEGDWTAPLLAATWEGNLRVVKYLVSLPSIDLTISDNRSNALHFALETKNLNSSLIDFLSSCCPESVLNGIDKKGSTPLDYAYSLSEGTPSLKSIVKLLEAKGAKRSKGAHTVRADVIQLLDEKYELEFPKGTPFIVACEEERMKDVRQYVEICHVDINMEGTDSEGDDSSGLLAAIWEGNYYAVDYLLKLPSIDVSTTINRSNVLHFALETQNKNMDIISVLLNHPRISNVENSIVNGMDKKGKTPLDYADNLANSDFKDGVVNLLESNGGQRSNELGKDKIERKINALSERKVSAPVGTGAKAVLALSPRKPVSGWDVFLSHDWGVHDKVKRISKALESRSILTWFDENNMSGSIIDSMTKGIDHSTCVLVFITKAYLGKVDGSSKNVLNDNCRREFDYAQRRKIGNHCMLIPVLMDSSLQDTKGWHGSVGMILGGELYFDLSSNELWDNCQKSAETFMDKIDELAIFIKRKVEGAGETLIVQNDPSQSQCTGKVTLKAKTSH